MFRHELSYIRFTKKETTNNLINKIIKLNYKFILTKTCTIHSLYVNLLLNVF